jgi:hypothetical protein
MDTKHLLFAPERALCEDTAAARKQRLTHIMRYPRSPKLKEIVNAEFEIKIVDSQALELRVNKRSTAGRSKINRTPLWKINNFKRSGINHVRK